MPGSVIRLREHEDLVGAALPFANKPLSESDDATRQLGNEDPVREKER